MLILPKNKKTLELRKIINVKGKVHYSETNQAWNMIKLKTEFLNEFNQLKEKRSKFSYELVFGRTKEETIEALKEGLKDSNVMLVLMWIYKEES